MIVTTCATLVGPVGERRGTGAIPSCPRLGLRTAAGRTLHTVRRRTGYSPTPSIQKNRQSRIRDWVSKVDRFPPDTAPTRTESPVLGLARPGEPRDRFGTLSRHRPLSDPI